MSNARLVPCSLTAYHSDIGSMSHSGLELVYSDPQEYEIERLGGALVEASKKTKPHFERGQTLEDALLRPGPCGNGVVLIPKEARAQNGALAGSAWDQFRLANKGKVLVKETDLLYQMVRAVQDHDKAREWVEAAGRLQETIYWHDDEHDVECRVRLDKIFDRQAAVMDLKSDRSGCSVDDCYRSIEKWGYNRQAELYLRGVEALYGVRPPFVFLFVSTGKIPRATMIELDEDWYPLAKQQNDEALKTYAKCKARGSWRPESHGKIIKLKPRSNYRDFSIKLETEDGDGK